jgi:hypothetical protein
MGTHAKIQVGTQIYLGKSYLTPNTVQIVSSDNIRDIRILENITTIQISRVTAKVLVSEFSTYFSCLLLLITII